MIALSSVNEIDKIIRNKLIEQSGIDGSNILNALSIYGDDLFKLVRDKVYKSYELTDSIILFETKSNETSNNKSFLNSYDNLHNSLIYYRSFRLKLIIYGNGSADMASVLAARFRTDKVREDLFNLGINIENVSDPSTVNEYKNNTLWMRNDLDIYITCVLNINPISSNYEADTINEIKIIKN